MPTLPQRLETAVTTVETDATKLHAIVHGAAGAANVVTEGGSVKPIAKVIAEGQASLAAAVDALEESATASAATATTKANEASSSATAAQTAKTAAETAETNAETAQAAAESARNAAQTAQTNAETAETNAETAQAAAEAARNLAQTYRDTASTHATTATTQASAASASAAAALASQNAAASSASSASSSATAAQNAIANGFLGGIAGASVPATASLAGNYYRITSAGTSQSRTWAVGDLAIYNGSSGSWTQIAGNVTDPASLANRTNALAPRGGVAFDGTSGARAGSTLTGQTIGTDPFSISIVVQVPTTNPSATDGFLSLGLTTSFDTGSPLFVRLSSSGALNVSLLSVIGSRSVEMSIAGFVSAYAGKTVHITAVRPASGNALLYINGQLQAPTYSVIGVGTWQDSISSTLMAVGSDAINRSCRSPIYSASLYNLALSASDVQEIYELGGGVPERFKFGSQALLNSSVFTNQSGLSSFSATATGWTGTAGSGAYFFVRSQPQFSARAGQRYRVRFDWSGGSPGLFRLGGIDAGSSPSAASQQTPPTNGANLYEVAQENTVINATVQFGFSSNGLTPNVTNISVQMLGAVVHLPLNDGAGYQLRDDSTNRLHALMTTTGVTHVLPMAGGAFPIRGTTNTSGNQQLGGAAIVPTNCQILRVRARVQSGTSTVSLGNASGGAQIVSGAALTTTWQVLTIVGGSHITSTTNLWVNSNNTNVVEWDIEAEELRT